MSTNESSHWPARGQAILPCSEESGSRPYAKGQVHMGEVHVHAAHADAMCICPRARLNRTRAIAKQESSADPSKGRQEGLHVTDVRHDMLSLPLPQVLHHFQR